MRQYKLNYFLLIFCLIIIKIEGGIFDWFKSKPRWYAKLEKTPLIETFNPKGLRISIGDFDGLQIFDFHAKINEPFSNKYDNGTLKFTIFEPKNGRWTYIDEDIEFKIDDRIYYWYYVKVNGEEYWSPKTYKTVHNLATYPGDNLLFERYRSTKCPCDIDDSLKNKLLLSNYIECDREEYKKLKIELENAKIEVNVLLETLLLLQKNDKNAPTLILTGKSSIITDPKKDVKIFLKSKLGIDDDLDDIIINAHYTDCGILFETNSLLDVERILIAAEKNTQPHDERKIYEPEKAECKHLNNNLIH
ncbi:uncharacterized protein LOC129615270 [Condylostylus longicornis]|uniref:uncharacterized protein LOC129615270 n=1 Tax=Condylostylus longicornis TaxID=2530218 RepID=UPI00244DB4E5|nr:uncharacterized protein LOC129615270 [Condylostylus longicornis]